MPYKDPIVRKQKSAERFASWASRNPEKANARMREWRHRNPKYMLHLSAKRRAAAKNLAFDITIEDIPTIPSHCPITGIPIFRRQDGKQGPCENSPSLDRKNPDLGYVKGNIAIISHKGNRWKNEMSRDDVLRLLTYIDS